MSLALLFKIKIGEYLNKHWDRKIAKLNKELEEADQVNDLDWLNKVVKKCEKFNPSFEEYVICSDYAVKREKEIIEKYEFPIEYQYCVYAFYYFSLVYFFRYFGRCYLLLRGVK